MSEVPDAQIWPLDSGDYLHRTDFPWERCGTFVAREYPDPLPEIESIEPTTETRLCSCGRPIGPVGNCCGECYMEFHERKEDLYPPKPRFRLGDEGDEMYDDDEEVEE